MTHHVVVLTYHLGPAVSRNPAEVIIGISNDPLQIRGGDQLFIGRKIHLFINEMNLGSVHGARLLFDNSVSVVKPWQPGQRGPSGSGDD
ncbi:hypothetical protein D3C74_433990 [compost metagenome]